MMSMRDETDCVSRRGSDANYCKESAQSGGDFVSIYLIIPDYSRTHTYHTSIHFSLYPPSLKIIDHKVLGRGLQFELPFAHVPRLGGFIDAHLLEAESAIEFS